MSESVSYFDKVISLINALVPVLAIYFAQRLWHAKNIERAHQAANDFLDEMTSLPMRVMLLETEIVRGLVRADQLLTIRIKMKLYVNYCVSWMTLIRSNFHFLTPMKELLGEGLTSNLSRNI